jgi:hypothetical protein
MIIYCFLVMLAGAAEVSDVQVFPITSLDGVISKTGVTLTKSISTDHNGALALRAKQTTTFQLYETGDIDIEEAVLFYQAKLKTLDVKGDAYLEMWCHFPGRGEYFSRGLQYAVSGTNDWVTVETPFILRKGENPDNIKLNLVINGKGRAWIDEIKLVKGELPPGA